MRQFPAFLNLATRRVLVVGDTPQARQRYRLAVDAGAIVQHLRTIGDSRPALGTALVFVATGSLTGDTEAARLARRAGSLVNVVDRPDLSDFIVPAIIDRGDVVVGVSTGGASPILARAIRERIESILPHRLSHLVHFAGKFRVQVRSLIVDATERRRFWSAVIKGKIGARVLSGDDTGAHRLMMSSLNQASPRKQSVGTIHLVGAGPGDPELLTLKALRVLQDADVILHDDLVGESVLAYGRREAERIRVGKRKGRPSHSQDAINRLMVSQALAGKNVVRLKGGDPFIFGRGAEEVEHARHHGIDVEVVPGITAALGCAATAGIALTHRQLASAVTLVTGHRADGTPHADWQALARGSQTVAVYMALSNAGQLRRDMLDSGVAPDMPLTIIQDGTLPTQSMTRGTVDDLPALAARHLSGGPAILIVGKVTAPPHSAATVKEAA